MFVEKQKFSKMMMMAEKAHTHTHKLTNSQTHLHVSDVQYNGTTTQFWWKIDGKLSFRAFFLFPAPRFVRLFILLKYPRGSRSWNGGERPPYQRIPSSPVVTQHHWSCDLYCFDCGNKNNVKFPHVDIEIKCQTHYSDIGYQVNDIVFKKKW